jgi:hypothetical protein
MLHSALNWLSYNRGLVFGLILALVCSLWLLGCEVTTQGLTDDRQVTSHQLDQQAQALKASLEKRAADLDAQIAAYNIDVAALQAAYEAAQQDLERKLVARQQIVTTLGGFVTQLAAGTVDPVSAVGSVVGLLGLLGGAGLAVDNRRKDLVIRTLKSGAAATGSPVTT